jgi:PAS domain S-box-containing protein
MAPWMNPEARNPAGQRWLSILGRTAAATGAGAAMLALAGWALEADWLRSVSRDLPASPVVAAALLGAAAALALPAPWLAWLPALAATTALAGLAAPSEAVGLLLVSLATLSRRRLAHVAAATLAAWAYIALLGHTSLPVALRLPYPSAAALLALGLAALLLPQKGPAALDIFVRGDVGSRLARWLVPSALVGIPLLAALHVILAQAGLVPAPGPGALAAFAGLAVSGAGLAAASAASRAAQARLAVESENLAVVRNAKDAILKVRADGAIEWANPAAQRMFHRNEENMAGHRLPELFAGEDARRLAEGLARHARDADASVVGQTVQMQAKRVGGTDFPVELSLAAVRPGTYVAVVRDASRHRLIEDALRAARQDALQAERAKAEFLANMSHEIRTPMNAIIGTTGLLADTRLDSEQQECVETIRASGEHLLGIVNDILDYSKAEAGKLQLETVPLDVRGVVEEAMDLVARTAQEKGIELAWEVDPSVPELLLGDPSRLRQVFLNLLSNAVKFTARGRVTVRVTATPKGEGVVLEAFVADTGIGIPRDRIDALFQMFSQVDASTTRAYGGTGLGLAICNRLVELMGGAIGVDSAPGRGTTFRFTAHLGLVRQPSPKDERAAFLAGRRVRVQAAQATQGMLEALCEAWGMQVVAADPDVEVMEASASQPDAAGATAARHDGPPRVLVGALGERPATGAFVSKPVRREHLMGALCEALGRPRDQAAARPAVEPLALRVLVAEDNPVNQKVAQQMLVRLGCRVVIASNGEEAVQAVMRETFDVVLMDVHMPVMDGLEAARRIRESAPVQPFIVALTADAMPGDHARFGAAGMDDYVAKPVRLDTLAQVLRRCKGAP